MKKTKNVPFPRLCAFSLLCLLWPALLDASTQQEIEEGFKPLFNGQNLDGWEAEPGQWRVEDGAIVGEIKPGERLDHNTWLIWKDGKLEDFELRLKFKIKGGGANSGIQFRAQAEDVKHVNGYQADMDLGQTWLGRIYDEHGRALIAERGTKVLIDEEGERHVQKVAEPASYRDLLREEEWNEYAIIAAGEHMTVVVNGRITTQLIDREKGERDLKGDLALQLHSGPETYLQFKDIRLKELKPGDHKINFERPDEDAKEDPGTVPTDDSGQALNLGFEEGDLSDWEAEGEAFAGQPVAEDGISNRWPGQISNKEGRYFIGGFELKGDAPKGRLTSVPFTVREPWASFLIGGGMSDVTRVEVVTASEPEKVIAGVSGADAEQMHRSVVNLEEHVGEKVRLRLVDDSSGGWGHINFDDFRFHAERPEAAKFGYDYSGQTAEQAAANMTVPEGFNVSVVAAEPDIFQPIQFCIDERGRLWVIEAHNYPTKAPEGQGRDRILIFEDKDADGDFETRKVFYEGLNLASGIEVGFGGVFVGQAPHLLFIPDADRDDQPDGEPEILLDGWGYHDTHETLNSFIWGPDGWLYGCHGVFTHSRVGKPGTPDEERVPINCGYWRYHPVKETFEVFAHGTSNPWGIDFNDYGQSFSTICIMSHFWHVVQGAYYLRQSHPLRHFNGHVYTNIQATSNHTHFGDGHIDNVDKNGAVGGTGLKHRHDVNSAAGGGHAHCGLSIYLGDNFPDKYRNSAFFFNVHGHRMNNDYLKREGSGWVAEHGEDLVLSHDKMFLGVAVKYGPDGSLYFIDWYDSQSCHTRNQEIWDRTNGRLYNIAYGEPERRTVDLAKESDLALAKLQLHKNDWYCRTARRILQERAARGSLDGGAVTFLRETLANNPDITRKLRALWCLHVTGSINERGLVALLDHESEWVRSWAIQLMGEDKAFTEQARKKLYDLAWNEPSQTVRLYLASALQRMPLGQRWQLARGLASHTEDNVDDNLPQMLWYGVEPLVEENAVAALKLALESKVPLVTNHLARRAAFVDEGVETVLLASANADADAREHMLDGLLRGLRGRSNLKPPSGWPTLSSRLMKDAHPSTGAKINALAALFGDASSLDTFYATARDRNASLEKRQYALARLAASGDGKYRPAFVASLRDPSLRRETLSLIAPFADKAVAEAIMADVAEYSDAEKLAAAEALSGKVETAEVLLKGLAEKRLAPSDIPASVARQIGNLEDGKFKATLSEHWGTITETPENIQTQMEQYRQMLRPGMLASADKANGRTLFDRTCASCHKLFGAGQDVGPDLTGANRSSLDYLLENILNPNALVGKDYRLNVVTLKDGRVLSGMIREETDSTLTLRTLTTEEYVPKDQVANRTETPVSMMPPGLLLTMNEDEVADMIAYLMGGGQVAPPTAEKE